MSWYINFSVSWILDLILCCASYEYKVNFIVTKGFLMCSLLYINLIMIFNSILFYLFSKTITLFSFMIFFRNDNLILLYLNTVDLYLWLWQRSINTFLFITMDVFVILPVRTFSAFLASLICFFHLLFLAVIFILFHK